MGGKRLDCLNTMALTNAEKQKRYRQKHPKRTSEAWQRYAHSDKGTVTLYLNYAQDRSRKHNLPYNLDREWLLEKLKKGVCELSGLVFVRTPPGRYRTHPFAPSIDRIEPHLGYVKENCRLVCFGVNRARSDWGDEILLQIAQGIVKGHTA